MSDQPKFRDGDSVEVLRPKINQWVRGHVYAFKEEDSVRKYFVQLAGYTAANASNPDDWIPEDQIRPSR